MNFTMPKNMLLLSLVAVLCFAGLTVPTHADDTEIFQVTASTSSAGRPKVLILFDDSGSMGTEVTGQRPAYDATKTDYDGGLDGSLDRVYWSKDKSPPSEISTQWFDASLNRCESSFDSLDNEGKFTAHGARRWEASRTETQCQDICSLTGEPVNFFGAFFCQIQGGTVTNQCSTEVVAGGWQTLSNRENTPPHVECQVDVINGEAGNGPNQADGFPMDNVADTEVYSGATAGDSTVVWGGTAYTFYSPNYVDYWNDDSLVEDRKRIDIAKDVISTLVSTNTGVDFGLATFNYNGDGDGEDGGRIIHRIINNMSSTERTNLVDMIDDDLTEGGSTPLCESAYEMYRYLTGDSVLFGDQRGSGDQPARDMAAESSGNYITPTSDCAYVYVILMTDGLPTYDDEATDYIEDLTGKTCRQWEDDIDNNGNPKNCLPELAEYMANTDLDGDSSNGNQFGITYTIGFATDQDLLEETAELGGGLYYTASSADALAEAFQGALLSILSTASTFTSPAVAVNTFSRTSSEDSVLYAMFKPDDRLDWRGNVKKLKVLVDDGDAGIVDKNGDPAIDPSTGYIKDDADTFWSTNDGGDVAKGGVGGLLAARVASGTARSIRTNTGTGGSLEAFNRSNLSYDAFGLSDDSQLYSYFGVSDEATLNEAITYGEGYLLDGSGNRVGREWVFADPLHSKPLMINYGGADAANPDLRIVVGTNGGFLHMFGNDDGQEDWAFFPKEHAAILNQRRVNPVSNDHVYGLDLTPVVYTRDYGRDGTLSSSDGDKAWLYIGMRRGGRDLYALDVSSPDSPSFLWRKSAVQSGMSEMGWTWSLPVVTKIPGYADGNGVLKPVVVVGGGYDTNKDASGVGTADSMGRGVFIFDAQTGALVRSITPAAPSAVNLQEAGLQHSVPAQVAVLDSNADGLTDRLYFADTGGNVWRVDIGSTVPTSTSNESWKITKYAELNGGTTVDDRRFFSAIDIVRIRLDDRAVDALLIGSGDRSNPLALDVDNAFYLLRDEQTGPYTTDAPTTSECDPDSPDAVDDFRCKLPLRTGDLYDITTDPLHSGTELQRANAATALNIAGGWVFRLTGNGEKSLSKSVTLDGTVYFTTFTPAGIVTNINTCEPRSGEGKLYAIDLYDGEADIVPMGPIIPETPTPWFPPPDPTNPDPKWEFIQPQGAPPTDDCADGACAGGDTVSEPYGNYWYREEY